MYYIDDMANTIETKLFANDGNAVELYIMNNGKHAVRMYDTDADKTVGITIYPSPARAKAGFDEMVAKIVKAGGC